MLLHECQRQQTLALYSSPMCVNNVDPYVKLMYARRTCDEIFEYNLTTI